MLVSASLTMVMVSLVFVPLLSWLFSTMGVVLFGCSLYFFMTSQAWVITWTWVFFSSAALEFLFFLDAVSLLFLGSISVISAAVLMFSRSYMANEKFYLRFHLVLLSFIASMVLLVSSPNLISLLLGWDGLGVTSFLLVIYFQSSKSYNAGMLTVLTNRIGDLLILTAVGLLMQKGMWNVFLMSEEMKEEVLYLSILLVVLSTFTKSAQVPFSAWLPAAMAAPTPVSSLVHSSTLVTAGVYLLIRFSPVIEWFNLSVLVLFAGILTMTLAGLSAIFESDMKKIVALSTLSQLGIMVAAVGLGLWEMAFIHLLVHAYFKALLFMSVGNMIHLTDDYQDLRKTSLSSGDSMTLSINGLASVSLCGFPFMAGFYSKDWVLEFALTSMVSAAGVALLLGGVGLTVLYSLRFYLLCWFATARKVSFSWEKDKDSYISLCYFILAPLALMGGSLVVSSFQLNNLPNISFFAKNSILLVLLISCFLVSYFYTMNKSLFPRRFSWSLGLMWGLPALSAPTSNIVFFPVSSVYKVFDLTKLSYFTISGIFGKQINFSQDFMSSLKLKFANLFMVFILTLIVIMLY